MKYCKGNILIILLCVGSLFVRAQSIIVHVTGYRNLEGDMIVALYKNSDQFPNEPALTVIQKKEAVTSDTLSIIFKNLLPGNYAVSVLDDENSNDAMDKRLLIPREGFCFSRFVPKGLKYPVWDNCCFVLADKDVVLHLQLYYF